jgi:hypothetical protein
MEDMKMTISRVFVVNLTYKWPKHPEVKRNTLELVRTAIENQKYGVGNAGFPSGVYNLSKAAWAAGFDEAAKGEMTLAQLTPEEQDNIYQGGMKRFKMLKDLKIGDVLIVNIPGHGVVAVGVVTQEACEGTALVTTSTDPFAFQVGLNWLIQPVKDGEGYKAIATTHQLGVIATATINPQYKNGLSLLMKLFVLAN